ncbi:hypothetical protein [Legionella pneumophila]|nr:hypothetical protein [Legionella pneumophila]HAT2039666.1 hypothetical protein [Legionella pneumophila]HEE0246044.1 hypothetical protein [Legionella pneumophila]
MQRSVIKVYLLWLIHYHDPHPTLKGMQLWLIIEGASFLAVRSSLPSH